MAEKQNRKISYPIEWTFDVSEETLSDGTKVFLATNDIFPELIAQGDSEEEALRIAEAMLEDILQMALHGVIDNYLRKERKQSND